MAALESSICALGHVQGRTRRPHRPIHPQTTPTALSSLLLVRNRRVLAVVAHSNGPNTQEEGSVFILMPKPSGRAFASCASSRYLAASPSMVMDRRQIWPLPLPQASISPGAFSLLSLTTKQGDIEGLWTRRRCARSPSRPCATSGRVQAVAEIVDADRRAPDRDRKRPPARDFLLARAVHRVPRAPPCMCICLHPSLFPLTSSFIWLCFAKSACPHPFLPTRLPLPWVC
ncbi:hypothetical protein K438DRAFT_956714 [Mycena galopus ATCC 62051]|nr:hypothetical protein K438DRAFT_956714 [Mycena galopus ATCC 62051]